MKANYPARMKKSLPLSSQLNSDKGLIRVSQVKEAVQIEWNKHYDETYEQIKDDITIQLMATVLCYLHQRYGWQSKVLNSVVRGTEDLFKMMMSGGIMGKEFNTEHCIEYLEKMGVEFYQKGGKQCKENPQT